MSTEELGIDFVSQGFEDLSNKLDAIDGKIDQTGETSNRTSNIIDTGLAVALGNILTKAADLAFEALTSVVDVMSEALTGAMDAEVGIARLESTLRSTGGVSGLTIEKAEELSMQFRDLAGGSDEAIIAIEEIGVTMGITAAEMPAYIQTVADLGAKMGSTERAAQLMARAQEDPIGAMNQLRRAGILFTLEEKEKAAAMVKSGDIAGAYALVMGKVGDATAGTAAAMADTAKGKIEIFNEHLADLGEGIMANVLPALEQIANVILNVLDSPQVTAVVDDIGEVIGNLANYIGFVVEEGDTLNDWLANLPEGIQPVVKAFGDLINLFRGEGIDFEEIITRLFGSGVFVELRTALENFASFFKEQGPAITAILSDLGEKLSSTFGPIISDIAGDLSVFIADTLYKLSEWFLDNGPEITNVVDGLSEGLSEAFTIIADAVELAWGIIQPLLAGLVDIVLDIGTVILEVLEGDWPAAWEAAKKTVNDAWAAIQQAFSNLAEWVTGWMGTTWAAVVQSWRDSWELFKIIVSLAWDAIVRWVTDAVNNIYNFLTETFNSLVTWWQEIWDAIQAKVQNIMDAISTYISTKFAEIKATITGILNDVKTYIETKMQEIKDTITNAINAVGKWITDKYNDFVKWGSSIVDAIKQGLQSLIDDNPILNFINAAIQSVKDWLGGESIIAKIAQIGSAIVDGIIQGIQDDWNGFVDFIRSKIWAAIDAVLAALGISGGESVGPTSVVFSQIGRSMMSGLQAGIGDMMPNIQAQLQMAVLPSSGGIINNYYNSNAYQLTTQSLVRPGGLAMEFQAMSMASR